MRKNKQTKNWKRSDKGTVLQPEASHRLQLRPNYGRHHQKAAYPADSQHKVKELREAAALHNCKNTTGTSNIEQNPLDYTHLRRFKVVQNPLDYTGKETSRTPWRKRESNSLGHLNNVMNNFTTGKQ